MFSLNAPVGDFLWGCSDEITGANLSGLYEGHLNTNEIQTSSCYTNGPKTAAQYCIELNDGGYSDWYLPTVEELKTLQKFISVQMNGINPCADYIVNFQFDDHWSSTEVSATEVQVVRFDDGGIRTIKKMVSPGGYKIAPIRSF